MMELIERRDVASQKVGVRLYFSQNDLVILILVPVRLMGKRVLSIFYVSYEVGTMAKSRL